MLEGIKLGLALNKRLNDTSLLQDARETYKDDDELGVIFQEKQTLLTAITNSIVPN